MASMKSFAILLFVSACLMNDVNGRAYRKQPHIVFILADDLGWDDVSLHGSTQIPTPTIDTLASAGVTLNNYYVQPVCSPTRSALMTGKYPIHTGIQDGQIGNGCPYGVPLNDTFLPEHLKQLGYSTHAVGKWHLGFYAEEYTPRKRGFDTHMGYYGGAEDYYTHKLEKGFDLRRNGELLWNMTDHYGAELFTSEAESVIASHDTSKPMFLYLAQQTPHFPYEAPQDWIDKFASIDNKDRETLAAMVSYLDDSVRRVLIALQEKDMLEDTIIVFSTDNGGQARGGMNDSASNYPLRGQKGTLWEGGVRGAGFVYGAPFDSQAGTVSNAMMHVSDWLPTLVHAAGGDPEKLSNLDGVSQWEALVDGQPSLREEILLNIQKTRGGTNAALRVGNMKLITGERPRSDDWFYPAGKHASTDERTVQCGTKPTESSHCTLRDQPCLFNLDDDPCEYNNLQGLAEYQSIYEMLQAKLAKYQETVVPSLSTKEDPQSDPSLHGGAWVPWVTL